MVLNWFDLLILILICVTLVKGFFSGLVMQIASLAGIVLGAIFAGKLSEIIAPRLIEFTDSSPHIVGPLSYILAFVVILVALFFAGKLLESFVDALKMTALNRIAGAFFARRNGLLFLVFCLTYWWNSTNIRI